MGGLILKWILGECVCGLNLSDTKDRIQLLAVVNVVMNLQVAQEVGISWVADHAQGLCYGVC
jgi:hypothetical protein